MDLNEEEIIKRCKAKDSRSQALLYERYAPMLFGMSLRYTASDDDAKDVLHDAFLKIFDSIKQYGGKGDFQAWMTRIVINEAVNLYRLRKRRLTDNFEDLEEVIMDNSVVVSDFTTHEVLLEFVRNMPEGYRTVFNLCEIEEYTTEEASKILNCNHSTCRSQLFKAKGYLRKKIEEFNKNEEKIIKK